VNFTISANPESVDVLIPSRGQVGTDEKRSSILPVVLLVVVGVRIGCSTLSKLAY
jgi:hypothetical protein